jgi:3-hydroxybutyryl-CoA dehydratase
MALEAGTELGPWTIESVDPEKMKLFAVALDDPNPIHLDPEAVKAAGLGDRVINQGPAGLGYLINMLRAAAPGARVQALRVRFTANVFGGDHVVAAGVVDAVEDGRASCRVWLDVSGGKRALAGTATLVLD